MSGRKTEGYIILSSGERSEPDTNDSSICKVTYPKYRDVTSLWGPGGILLGVQRAQRISRASILATYWMSLRALHMLVRDVVPQNMFIRVVVNRS